jgi:uncharacterized RDD family membrane protein YckC
MSNDTTKPTGSWGNRVKFTKKEKPYFLWYALFLCVWLIAGLTSLLMLVFSLWLVMKIFSTQYTYVKIQWDKYTKPWSESVSPYEVVYAGVWKRLQAHMLDIVIVSIVVAILVLFSYSDIASSTSPRLNFAYVISVQVIFVILLYPIFVTYDCCAKGTTLGKRISYIRIIDRRTFSNPKLVPMIIRSLCYSIVVILIALIAGQLLNLIFGTHILVASIPVSGFILALTVAPLILSLVSIVVDKEKRGLIDKVSGTAVIDVQKTG